MGRFNLIKGFWVKGSSCAQILTSQKIVIETKQKKHFITASERFCLFCELDEIIFSTNQFRIISVLILIY